MKNTFNQWSVALLAILALGQSAAVALSPSDSIQWRFDSNAATLAPEVGAVPGIQAVVSPGPFGSGWISQNAYFGAATGVWDLGRRGTIAVGNLDAVLGDSTADRTFKLKVVQWFDGAIYTTPAEVSVPGAVLLSRVQSALGPVIEGLASTGWVVEETQWSAAPGSPVTTLTVTGAYDGSLVDSVVLQRSVVSTADLVLNIQSVNGVDNAFELSWPEAAGSATIESTTDLSDPGSWTTFSATPQLANGQYKVTTSGSAGVRYFRLKR